MEKLIPLISDIQEIIRKSDVNLEVSLPMIAVVGSQSTGTFIFRLRQKLIIVKHHWKVIFTQGKGNRDPKTYLNSACANPGRQIICIVCRQKRIAL